ncbi:hypothetical protein [Arenibacter sp. ARW7G5Y1]|uniref:hypothetical protein n=1 Tax=Arenibacter sp. ARW7G5Y1 TaxID=2135619 RepID=UPI000D76CE96|nr:hypothetical protein [Arenibacter sp. ARW7G5Y1]PXX23020.1 hypothetical protein C7972_1218 [Arenibacter sp. ARW7G5Y1]
MKTKYKALIFNFLGFSILFVGGRLLIGMLLSLNTLALAFIAAVAASILAPKFSAVKTKSGEKLMMKWIFIKGFREL